MALLRSLPASHPFAEWHRQKTTDRERYIALARDHQAPARRLVICGMHVHVGIADPELRIDLMGQLAYFLPISWRSARPRLSGKGRIRG